MTINPSSPFYPQLDTSLLPGVSGQRYALQVGTVTTGASGSSAAATLTGNPPNQRLNLTIPRGTAGTNWVPYYGAFQDETTQTIASTTAAYAMKLGITDFTNGVTVVTDGSAMTRITFANAGVYNIQWSGQFINADTDNVPVDVSIWLRKNGTDVAGSNGIVSIPARYTKGQTTIDGKIIAGWNYFVTVAANQYVQFMWCAESTSVTMATSAAGTTPTTPTTASLIVTAQQIA